MADITVSTTIDTFMQAADAATARTALGVADAPSVTPLSGTIVSNVAYLSSFNSTLHLTEDVYELDWSAITVPSGESGLIEITQDGNGPWTFFGGIPDDKYLAGDTADIAAMVSGDICTVGWYCPGESSYGSFPRMYFYVSDVSN